MLVLALAAAGTLWVLRTKGTPEETADSYLSAWSVQDYARMRELVADPPADFERRHQRFRSDLQLTGATFERDATSTGGTVTFLFTDVEGSTRLWAEHTEAMDQAMARHDALLRRAIEAHTGSVFSTAGDSFGAAFHRAADAAAAWPACLRRPGRSDR